MGYHIIPEQHKDHVLVCLKSPHSSADEDDQHSLWVVTSVVGDTVGL